MRNQKIMLDQNLAEMYKVETRRLNEQAKRNLSRFSKDFMFTLKQKAFDNLMSQIATSGLSMDQDEDVYKPVKIKKSGSFNGSRIPVVLLY